MNEKKSAVIYNRAMTHDCNEELANACLSLLQSVCKFEANPNPGNLSELAMSIAALNIHIEIANHANHMPTCAVRGWEENLWDAMHSDMVHE